MHGRQSVSDVRTTTPLLHSTRCVQLKVPAMMYEKGDQPFSHRLFENDEGTRRALRIYFKIVVSATVMISLTIWGILSIYWGERSVEFSICWRFEHDRQVPTGGYSKEYIT